MSDPVGILGETVFEPSWRPKCITCVTMFFEWQAMGSEGEAPAINDAVTYAPAWQQHMIGNQITGMQLMYACIALPTCMGHLGKIELTPEQQAVKGGILLPGSGAANLWQPKEFELIS